MSCGCGCSSSPLSLRTRSEMVVHIGSYWFSLNFAQTRLYLNDILNFLSLGITKTN